MSVFLPDAYGTYLEINPQYVMYRKRLIDMSSIATFQTKSRKVTINTFKQNQHLPTMCIWFKDVTAAKAAVATLVEVAYGVERDVPEANPEPAPVEPRDALESLVPKPVQEDYSYLYWVGGAYLFMIFLFNLLFYANGGNLSKGQPTPSMLPR